MLRPANTPRHAPSRRAAANPGTCTRVVTRPTRACAPRPPALVHAERALTCVCRATNRLSSEADYDDATGSLSSIDRDMLAWNNPLEAWKQGQMTLGFSAGGLLFPYFLGIMWELQEEGVLTEDMQVAGASAGSIIATCTKAGLSQDVLLDAFLELVRDCRQGGTMGRLREVLHKTLDRCLPEDIHLRCNGKVHMAVTNVWPKMGAHMVDQYTCRNDLINSVLISCHIPWYFDGSLATKYRDSLALDGGLTNLIPVPPGNGNGIRVSCFPAATLTAFGEIHIAPDTFEPWEYSMSQMVAWALEPGPDDILYMLIEKGKRDARTWTKQTGISDYAAAEKRVREKLKSGVIL